MKIISDIRLYEGDDSKTFRNKRANLAAHRVAMKLREKAFSLGEYDHLYLCFSPDKPEESVFLEDKVDRCSPWFRKVYIGLSQDELVAIETAEEPTQVLNLIENVLLALFGVNAETEITIREAITEAKKGSEMLMCFKEKKTAKGTAIIYLRLLDSAYYLPLLSVINAAGDEVLREDLPKTIDFGILGKIQLSSKKVIIKPRNNVFTESLEPIEFSINL